MRPAGETSNLQRLASSTHPTVTPYTHVCTDSAYLYCAGTWLGVMVTGCLSARDPLRKSGQMDYC